MYTSTYDKSGDVVRISKSGQQPFDPRDFIGCFLQSITACRPEHFGTVPTTYNIWTQQRTVSSCLQHALAASTPKRVLRPLRTVRKTNQPPSTRQKQQV